MRFSQALKLSHVAALIILLMPIWARAADIEEVKSPGNLSAYLIEDHQSRLISLAIAFKAGWAYEPQGKEGVSTFVAAMMNEGAGHLTSQEFQKELADHGIEFSADNGADDFTITMTFLTEEKDRAADLLRLALTKLRLDEDAMTRNRQQLIAILSRERNDPDWISGKGLQTIVFKSHPYAKGGIYSEASLNAITAQDLRQFMADHFTRASLKISAVGDIDGAGLSSFMEKVFAELPSKSKDRDIAGAELGWQGGIGIIKRDIPQSVITFAGPGIKKTDPDFYAAYILNHILGGGGFGSRLMEEIRVKRGLSYGINTELIDRDHATLLAGNVNTKRSSTQETIDLIKSIYQEMRDNGPTAKELERAKTYIIGYYPRNFVTLESSAGLLLALQLDDLGIDYPRRRRELFEKVTLEDVKRAAKRLLDPNALTFVIVGEPELKATLTIPSSTP